MRITKEDLTVDNLYKTVLGIVIAFFGVNEGLENYKEYTIRPAVELVDIKNSIDKNTERLSANAEIAQETQDVIMSLRVSNQEQTDSIRALEREIGIKDVDQDKMILEHEFRIMDIEEYIMGRSQ